VSWLALNRLLDAKLVQVRQRLQDLLALEAELQGLRSRCRDPVRAADCGILQGLSEAAQSQR
jgi:hypothetical protein